MNKPNVFDQLMIQTFNIIITFLSDNQFFWYSFPIFKFHPLMIFQDSIQK